MDMSNQRPRGTVNDFLKESGDWRDDLQLQVDLRQRSMSEIFLMLLQQQDMSKMHRNTDTLKRHHSFSSTQELKEMALKYEQDIYAAATSQSDYLRKVSLKKSAIHSKSDFNRVNPSDAAFKDQTGIKRKAASLDLTGNLYDRDWQEGYQKEIGKSNWRLTQGAGGALDNSCTESGDWRAQLQTDLRHRIMNKIMDTFKTHVPFSEDEGIQELKKIAVRFEEKIFNAASSESDYLYKISLKMLTAEDIFEDFLKDAYNVNPSGPGSLMIKTVNSQGQPLPIHVSANDTQPTQQPMLLPFMHNRSSTPVQASPVSTGNLNGGDWQEEVYQKIKAMKDLYLQDLKNMHQKLLRKLEQQPTNEQHEKLKAFKNMLARFMQFLQIPKHHVLANYKDKLGTYEKQIVLVINSNLRKPTPEQQEGQALPPPHMHSLQKQSQQTLSQLKRVQLTLGGSGAGDWRARMAASFRQRTVNNITDTLKRHLTVYGDQGLQQEVKSIAESFEENVYTAATSQFDYEQKILLILNLESRPQNHMPNA